MNESPVTPGAGSQHGGSRPDPDPTVVTVQLIDRVTAAEREYIDGKIEVVNERLNGIDEATKLRLSGVEGVPGLIDEKVRNLSELHGERFASIAIQFRERDERAKSEAELKALALVAAFNAAKEAVAAALTAQKEDAARRDEANEKAINKSEKATAETIKTNQELSATRMDALTKSLDEVKIAVSRIDSVKLGANENRDERRQSNAAVYAAVAAVIGVVVVALTVIGFILTRLPA